MFKIFSLIALCLVVGTALSTVVVPRQSGGYIQQPSGAASFTRYSNCGSPACGKTATGYTAAMNQLAFGSAPGLGPGDASYNGPFNSIVVKVTDLCPASGNQASKVILVSQSDVSWRLKEWCGQTASNPKNSFNMPFHFDICDDTGGSAAFFPSGRGAFTGTFAEVSCSNWSGTNGGPLWNGACLAGESAANWPAVGCGNQG